MGRRFRDWRESVELLSIPELNSGCHLWLGAISSEGYPVLARYRDPEIKGRKKQIRVCRLVLSSIIKGLLTEEIKSRHTCDNILCVSPYHIIPGTTLDNIRDMVRRDRCKAPHSRDYDKWKLTQSDRDLIKTLYKSGLSTSDLSHMFDVGVGYVSRLVRR